MENLRKSFYVHQKKKIIPRILKKFSKKHIKTTIKKKIILKVKKILLQDVLKSPSLGHFFAFKAKKNNTLSYVKHPVLAPRKRSTISLKSFQYSAFDFFLNGRFSVFCNTFFFDLLFKNQKMSASYSFQGRISYLSQITPISHRFFFAAANQWINLRDLSLIYELLFFFRSSKCSHYFFEDSSTLSFFSSILFYEKLNYFIFIPRLIKNFFNFSECLLKIKLTSSNFFFTALDSLTYKTLLTGTGGMWHMPLARQSNKLKTAHVTLKKKFAKRQDVKHKKTPQNRVAHSSTVSRSKKFLKKHAQPAIKKKRPKWIEKTSFTSLFYLCDKFFHALKDFGYLQLRFWLLGHKVYNVFFKKKVLFRWKKQYKKLLFLSPFIIFQSVRRHNGMRFKKTRRV